MGMMCSVVPWPELSAHIAIFLCKSTDYWVDCQAEKMALYEKTEGKIIDVSGNAHAGAYIMQPMYWRPSLYVKRLV